MLKIYSLERLTEDSCLRQIDACARLGISHFQLDWGWQESDKWILNRSPLWMSLICRKILLIHPISLKNTKASGIIL